MIHTKNRCYGIYSGDFQMDFQRGIQLAELQTLFYQSDSILAHFHNRWEMLQRTHTQVNFREKKFQTQCLSRNETVRLMLQHAPLH